MAKRARRQPASRQPETAPGDGGGELSTGMNNVPAGTTGRFLVLLKEGAGAASVKSMGKAMGVAMASSADYRDGAAKVQELGRNEGMHFPDLGVAIVNTPPQEMQAFAASAESEILAIEPERVVYALDDGLLPPLPPSSPSPRPYGTAGGGYSLDYLRGYRDAVNTLCDKLIGPGAEFGAEAEILAFSEAEITWGLQATKVPASRFTGKGIRVAVLDTGLDTGHPDLVGRHVTTQSFVQGQPVQDGNGHGTHCIGTSCGTKRPGRLPRYGIAFEADIFAGKVLSNQGSGGDGGILAGIQWAVQNQCAVVSMSLGAPTQIGQPPSQVFEQAANRALAAGTLIIAAAGNESRRPQVLRPVGHPANCPSIMAVAAIDRNFQVAFFSDAGLNPQGGQVDIAGPGVDVISSWPRPTLYNSISGTSMATPHVAGIAALWAQSSASLRGRALANMLAQSARRLPLPARDIGSGLVQAP